MDPLNFQQVVNADAAEKKRVLIVDDDAGIRMLLKMAFEYHGYTSCLAENGIAAQAHVERESFDAMVVDLMMPMMDGLSFIHWLRQTARRDTPVLVLTSVQNPEVAQQAMAAGANGVALKPISLPDMFAQLKKLLPA